MSTLLKVFATNIRKYRIQKGLSQEQLAEKSGLHRTYISALERERRNISIRNIERIATVLNVQPHKLLIP